MSYAVDKPPSEDALLRTGQRSWELTEHRPNVTMSRAAYRPYSTYVLFSPLPILDESMAGTEGVVAMQVADNVFSRVKPKGGSAWIPEAKPRA